MVYNLTSTNRPQNPRIDKNVMTRTSLIATVLAGCLSFAGVSHSQPPKEQPSLEQVEAEVLALKKADVAWRKIEWKTCLLDGLRASQDEKKPIMLWVFIDRPIDDERC